MRTVLTPEKTINNTAEQNPNTPVALELRHLSAGYSKRRAVEDVSVHIPAGQRIGLIGPNGAGKSTLFRAIVGLVPPMSGQVLINGESSHQSRRQAAYVPQFEDVDWNFPVTVIDVVVMGLARQVGWFRLPGASHIAIASAALKRVGLEQYGNRQIGELSGGEKRRVFIARALAQGAGILLLDEPFSGVDASAQQTLFNILDELKKDGVTVLLATHDLNLAATHFDQLIIMNRQLVAFGKPEDVLKPDVLAKAFNAHLAIWHGDEQVMMLTDQHA